MAIPDTIIDQIQNKVDIVEVVSQYIPIKKTGRNYKACCPFHNEKTPSFVVSPDKQIYHCFGCGAGGNVFSFVMRQENIEFPEAVEMLAEKAGVRLPRLAKEDKQLSSLANQLYKANDLAGGFFQTCLSNNAAAKEYLHSRGISDETIKKFRIGYAPDGWEGLANFFKKQGIAEAQAEKAGLIISNERGGHYDRFRNRVTFPIQDLKERVLGFGARVLDSSLPKYMNSPETYIYSKGKHFYGLNLSKEHIRKAGYALVVEGYLDFIIPYQAGINAIVATLGTALTVDQVKLLKRFAPTVVMVYDPDEAGEAASLRNMDLFINEDVSVYIAELPKGFDPDTYIRKFGAEDFGKHIKASKNLFDYKLGKLSGRFDMRTMHGKAAIAGEMLPTISRINNAVLKSGFIKKLAEKLSVDEESLREELKKVKADYSERRYTLQPKEARKSARTAEKMIVALILEGAEFIDKVRQDLSLDEFKDTSVRDVVQAIFSLHEKHGHVNPATIINHLGTNTKAAVLVSEAVTEADTFGDRDKVLADCVARIKKDALDDQCSRLQAAIKNAHESKDEEGVKKLLAEYDVLIKNNKACKV